MADGLERYRAKRDFTKTAEPPGGEITPATSVFVVQKHAARRLHYDLRLQFGDTLKSWAVPQGPSLDPKVRRLAVHTEDHPLEYADFEQPIPKGQYGAGAMIVWDRGTWIPMGDAAADYRKGTLKFRLSGEKLGGGWMLVRLKPKDGERGDNWLLIKERDSFARPGAGDVLLDERPESVLSGRLVEDLRPPEEAPPAVPARRKAKPVKVAALEGARRAPLPDEMRPQLATSAARVPDGEEWLHEIKFDGYRTLVRLERGEARLITRSGLDWTDRYGQLAKAFAPLPCKQALIDGEVVVQDERGIASFAALQDALAEGRTHALIFFAFDLLHLDGYDLTATPLSLRKQALEGLLEPVVGPSSAVQISGHVQGNGPAFFAQAAKLGLEGVISKRADAAYQQGRTRSWLKVKCRLSEEFLVVGYNPSDVAGGIGALLLAENGDSLRYVGRVGTGFSMAGMRSLKARLDALRASKPTVVLPPEEKRKGILWVRPVLSVEVEYANRTADRILRHAVYKGLRLDEAEDEAGAKAPVPEPPPQVERKRYVTDADLAAVWVTNPDRPMFGEDGPTKLELALYYARVGDWMLPELIDRPVSLVRCPTGKVEDTFFQRHAMAGMPEVIKTIPLKEGKGRTGEYLYLENARGLLSLAQFGAVEFHSWGCRIDQPERPDRIVFDLDPDEGLPWRQVVDAAFEVRAALQELGLVPFLKTTGGKGLHVVVPLQRRQGWEPVRSFCETFARAMAGAAPRRYTANMAKAQRRGRIFLDYLRNVRGATAVAAYSLRARPGVPVSTPLSWEELAEVDDPADLNYATVPERLAAGHPDPWAGIDQSARALTRSIERKLEQRAK